MDDWETGWARSVNKSVMTYERRMSRSQWRIRVGTPNNCGCGWHGEERRQRGRKGVIPLIFTWTLHYYSTECAIAFTWAIKVLLFSPAFLAVQTVSTSAGGRTCRISSLSWSHFTCQLSLKYLGCVTKFARQIVLFDSYKCFAQQKQNCELSYNLAPSLVSLRYHEDLSDIFWVLLWFSA